MNSTNSARVAVGPATQQQRAQEQAVAAVSLAASGWKTHCDFRGVKCEHMLVLTMMKQEIRRVKSFTFQIKIIKMCC